MALLTTLELLEDVEAAIQKALKGQSGTWDGKSVTLADLAQLYKIRTNLKNAYLLESGTGGGITINKGVINRE